MTKNNDTAATPSQPTAPEPKPAGGKIASLLQLMRRPEGARIDEMIAATGWQTHSVRGAISGTIKKKLGVSVTSEKVDGVRIYRAQGEAA